MQTAIKGLTRWPGFLEGLWGIVEQGTRTWYVGERRVRAHHFWFRDHIHMLKFGRYFDAEPASVLQFLVEHQHEEGFFHEILTSSDDLHLTYVPEKCRLDLGVPLTSERHDGRRSTPRPAWLMRLELEADIEYLMVEGAARAWEATGDDGWKQAVLPSLESGIRYSLEHPDRRDTATGLVKRPFTIDTWDFCWGRGSENRGIQPDTPMSIHYGDNAGVYGAMVWLAEQGRGGWAERAEAFRRTVREVCWSGRHYTHQVLLQPIETGGAPESEILSLSNAYAINRGLPSHEEAVAILNCYRELKAQLVDTGEAVAEWSTLYPPYPKFAMHEAWDYVNGGIAPFLGGELATAAFNHGMEDYGVDILDRLFAWWRREEGLRFLYSRTGEKLLHDWGPSGWGAAAIGQALLEGMAGIGMNAATGRIVLTPRWVAADEREVEVDAAYPASGFGLRYRFRHEPATRTIRLEGQTPDKGEARVLLPRNARSVAAILNRNDARAAMEAAGDSNYASVSLPPGEWDLSIEY